MPSYLTQPEIDDVFTRLALSTPQERAQKTFAALSAFHEADITGIVHTQINQCEGELEECQT